MSTYVFFGKYTTDSIKGVSAKRTEDAAAYLRTIGGEVQNGYALLGATDLVLIVDLPDNERALKASAGLTRLTGITFTTAPAVSIKEFDKLLSS